MPSHKLAAVPVLLWLGVALAPPFGAALPPPSSKCQRKCGGVNIPYPFGLVGPDSPDHCAMPGFNLSCNEAGNGGRRPFYKDVEVVSVSLLQGQARMRMDISYYCYNTTTRNMSGNEWWLNLKGTPYRFSDTTNKFTVIGCQTLVYMVGEQGDDADDQYMSGCVAMCRRRGNGDILRSALSNGSCSGIGCCQTAIPKGLQYYGVMFDPGFNTMEIHNVSRCSYAVLMDSSNFTFSTSYVTSRAFIDHHGGQAPFVVDWSIGNETCDAARKKPWSYACVSDNSECLNSLNGQGYICNCSKGFDGNPYLQDRKNGCKEIDECKHSQLYRCTNGGVCRNRLGGYDCPCKFPWKGDPNAGTCTDHFPRVAKAAVCLAGLVVLIVLIVLAHQLLKLRKFYKQNGGPILEGVKNIRIYKSKELKQVTNNYNDVIGEGHFGKVYKGTLKDTQEVAIKKTNEASKKDFIDEVIIQSGMRHKNIVRLLGCCLEMDVPMLMYEYVVEGSLYDVLFKRKESVPVDTRLRIAIGSAEGLAYMHSAVESTIRHGDVKSANILLDASFTPKISDFGTSKPLARGKSEKTEWVTGDKAYIDPAYMVHGILTQKSDVYSFGIVLIELITRRVAKYDDNMSYVKNFVEACQDQRVRNFVDNDITSENDIDLLEMVSEVAHECLKLNPEERLDMRQVENRLIIICQSEQHGQERNCQGNLSPSMEVPLLKPVDDKLPTN